MKKVVIAVGIITILIGAMGFGVMVGVTYNTTGYGDISVGSYLSDTTFVYAGLSFPFGIVGGGGTRLGNIFSTDLGKSSEGKNIGKLSISWGALGSVGVDFFSYHTYFGAFAGPAIFLDWNSDFIKGKLMEYTALGLAISNYDGMKFDTSFGMFYRF